MAHTQASGGRLRAIKATTRAAVERAADRAALLTAKGRPVFVGASPRSGTTLLRTMLNSHPDLGIPLENRFIARAFQLRRRFGDPVNPTNRERLVEWIVHERESSFTNLDLDADEAAARMMNAPGATLGSIMGVPLMMYAEAQSASRWGDKRPAYIRNTGRIFSLFPDAQFVHLVRDPRGSVASMLKVGWYKGSVPRAVDLWMRSIEAAVAAKASLRPHQFYELKYEDLLGDPSTQVRELTAWLRLNPGGVAQMLDFHHASDVPTSKYHWRVSEPLDETAASGWTTSLDPAAVALVEHITGDHMERLGYHRSSVAAKADPTMIAEYEHWALKKAPRSDSTRRIYQAGTAALLTPSQRRHAKLVRIARRVRR